MAAGKIETATNEATATSLTAAPPSAVPRTKRGVPEGLWKRCPGCQATIFRKEAEKRLYT